VRTIAIHGRASKPEVGSRREVHQLRRKGCVKQRRKESKNRKLSVFWRGSDDRRDSLTSPCSKVNQEEELRIIRIHESKQQQKSGTTEESERRKKILFIGGMPWVAEGSRRVLDNHVRWVFLEHSFCRVDARVSSPSSVEMKRVPVDTND
jgi:hypothetical protein